MSLPEPEQLSLWRRIIARRDALVAEIERWSGTDHPVARDLARIVAIHGAHGLTPRRLVEIEGEVAQRLSALRGELDQMDRIIEDGSRRDPKDVGLSMLQLRLVADAERARALESARAAVERWCADRQDTWRRVWAEACLRRIAAPGTDVDLVKLDVKDRTPRQRNVRVSRQPQRVAQRIVAELASH